MKTILALVFALNLATCATTLPAARLSYARNDGKAYLEFDGKSVTAGYTQRLR
jgi:hypothetical protein